MRKSKIVIFMLVMLSLVIFLPPLLSLLLNNEYIKQQALTSDFSAWMSDMDLERILWVTAIAHLCSTLITLPRFSLKAFSTTAPVESGLENLCGSLDSSLLSASCSLGFTPALPFTGNISFSSFLFLHSDHSLSVGWKKLCSSCTLSSISFSSSHNPDRFFLTLCMCMALSHLYLKHTAGNVCNISK